LARLISRTELAKIAGVSDQAVSQGCKTFLSAACKGKGKRVNLDHPDVVAWLRSKGRDAPELDAPGRFRHSASPELDHSAASRGKSGRQLRPRSTLRRPTEGEPGSDEDLDNLASQLAPLLARFGTTTGFKDWLNALKTITDIRGKRLDNDKLEGRLIERDLVSTHVFGALEALHKRLLTDLPSTIAQQLYSSARAGVSLEEAKIKVRQTISDQLHAAKLSASRALRTDAQ
jgi:hypothetical protein